MTSDLLFCRDFLCKTYPFSLVSPAGLEDFLSGLQVDHLPAREILTEPVVGVLLRGAVHVSVQGLLCERVIEGGFFGFVSLLDMNLPDLEIRSEEDCSFVTIPVPAFLAMLEREEAVRVHFERRCEGLRILLDAVRNRGVEPEADPFLRLAVGNIILDAPVFVPPAAMAREAARLMRVQGASACLVGDLRRVAGIVTEKDLVAQAERGGLDVPVKGIMTAGLITVRGEELVFEAFTKMIRHNIRRLVVVDDQDRPVGLLQERDMLSAHRENPLHLAGEVAAARDEKDLARCFERLRVMVLRCAAERIGVESVGRLVADINDQIMSRAVGLIIDELGLPSGEFSLMALGSEGRREQLLATDQDNALVFSDSAAPGDAAYFEAFGQRLVGILTGIGFPSCPRKVMVDNPFWRRSFSAWREGVNTMIRVVDADAVLCLTQLADARHVHGDPRLCEGLRAHIHRQVRDTPVLLKYMAREALRFTPPMGFFRNLVVEKSGPAKGCLDLKKGGIFPLTQGLKTLALEHGLSETGSITRLQGLRREGVFSGTMAEDLRDAFDFLQALRLRTQAARVRTGAPPSNLVRPDLLPTLEREGLKDAFRVVLDFQSFLHTKYGLHLIP
jgi:CBS domain-containing protein